MVIIHYANVGSTLRTQCINELIYYASTVETTPSITDTGTAVCYGYSVIYTNDDMPSERDEKYDIKPSNPSKTHPYQLRRVIRKSALLRRRVKKNRSSNMAIGWR